MSSTLPAQNPFLINDLVPGVIEALTGKTNITPQQCAVWIKKTLLNLTESYPFEELRVLGPLVTIGPGLGMGGSNFMYPISMFLNPGDDYTLSENPVIFFTPTRASNVTSVGLIGTGQFQNGQVAYAMPYMTMKAIQSLLFISGGIPSRWSHYGPNFFFGTQPATNYQMYLPYQIRYPFNETNLLQTHLYIPDVVDGRCRIRSSASRSAGQQVARYGPNAPFDCLRRSP